MLQIPTDMLLSLIAWNMYFLSYSQVKFTFIENRNNSQYTIEHQNELTFHPGACWFLL